MGRADRLFAGGVPVSFLLYGANAVVLMERLVCPGNLVATGWVGFILRSVFSAVLYFAGGRGVVGGRVAYVGGVFYATDIEKGGAS